MLSRAQPCLPMLTRLTRNSPSSGEHRAASLTRPNGSGLDVQGYGSVKWGSLIFATYSITTSYDLREQQLQPAHVQACF
jgi:hypothetical protein